MDITKHCSAMRRKYFAAINILLGSMLIMTLSSCMHMMMGGHNDDMKSDASIEKRITENNLDVIASIPVMETNKTQFVTVLVHRADSKLPVTGAEVSYHWMHMPMAESEHDMSKMTDTSMVSGTAKESTPGTYSFELSNLSEGRYSLSLAITADSTSKPISFDVERNIPMQHSMGMMGMGSSSTTPWIVTGALMATMMVVMWAVRGGI